MVDKNSRVGVEAMRHLVYRELIDVLPPASLAQCDQFISNLALTRAAGFQTPLSREAELWNVRQRLINLRVTPDLAQTEFSKFHAVSFPEIEEIFAARFGDGLSVVPGFYKSSGGDWRLNLPEGCALLGYFSELKFYRGILCQPLDRRDFYFLLSSAKFGGPQAERPEREDLQFFERYKNQARSGLHAPPIQAGLSGYSCRGRRLRQLKNSAVAGKGW